jgi:DHA1 family bicyclomycin/chloramphenicol resistance-like MFS transporter
VVISRAVLRDIHGPSGTTNAISGMFLIMVWIPILAPVVGGFLASFSDWQSSFLVMAAVALLTLAGSWFWLTETAPMTSSAPADQRINWLEVLLNRIFLRHALANMFCIGTMILFLANYSFLAEQHYGLNSTENGYILAGFNISISIGVYLVRWLVPIFDLENTIYAGLWIAVAGWLALWGLCLAGVPGPLIILVPIMIACLGTGMVISLTVGQALVPFAYVAGVASALFVCMQSGGSSLISFLAGVTTDGSLISLVSVALLCSVLALASMRLTRVRTAH